MRIAVCGKHHPDCENLAVMLSQRLIELCADIDVVLSDDGNDLVAKLESPVFIFLDADMSNPNSVELARQIREKGFECPIFFYSDSSLNALDSYSVYPSGFLLKPFDYTQLCKTIDWYRDSITPYLRKIDIVTSRIPLNIYLADIISIEVQGRICVVNTNNGNIKTNQPLSVIMDKLSGIPFFRCHRNFIVNLCYLSEIACSELLMTNGSSIPISPDNRKVLRQMETHLKPKGL